MLVKTEAMNKTQVADFYTVNKKFNVKKDNTYDTKENKDLKREDLEDLVEKGNLGVLDKRLEFKIHEKTNRIIVKLIDKDTDKVIKEIPGEDFLNLVSKIEEFIGVFVDERV